MDAKKDYRKKEALGWGGAWRKENRAGATYYSATADFLYNAHMITVKFIFYKNPKKTDPESKIPDLTVRIDDAYPKRDKGAPG